jgi:hypothetical protein
MDNGIRIIFFLITSSLAPSVYIYGFSKIEGGVCHGAFQHQDFLRGQRDLSLTIGRNKCGDRRLKSSFSRKVRDVMLGNPKPLSKDGFGARVSSAITKTIKSQFVDPTTAVVVCGGALPSGPMTHSLERPVASAVAAAARSPIEPDKPMDEYSADTAAQAISTALTAPSTSSSSTTLKTPSSQSQQVSSSPSSPFEDWLLSSRTDTTRTSTRTNTNIMEPLELSSSPSYADDSWIMSFLEPRPIEQMCAKPLSPHNDDSRRM